ncbi:SIMPL domain-containing protein [Falsigemmobacter faecalis]|uniref:SIMPL domain-containing protein n=2 Tax=Falsigemmobacter faecalis TaxID=2488730 RepID=A0A3P3DSU1_9RHOB|nr:SIMPL domain-containing protein [Falsigemmobacter faecalis]
MHQGSEPMRRTLTGLLAAAMMAQLAAAPLFAQEMKPVITVTGEAGVKVAPDMATIRIGVDTLEGTAAEAMQNNSAQMRSVQEALRASGLQDRDLQTSGLSVQPEYSYPQNGERVLQGYRATNGLNVQVRDLAKLGGILDQVTKDGANNIGGLSFGLQESGKAQDEARVAAVKEARRRAEMMAEAEGVKLGRVLEIREGSEPAPRPMMRMAAAEAAMAPAPIEAGEMEFSTSVTLTWELIKP